jgi:type I restriction enzyme S subunit
MAIKVERVGDVLALERIPVEPDPTTEYVTIGARSFGRGLFHYEPRIGEQLGSLRFFEVLPDRLVISNIKGWEGAIAVSGIDDYGCLASNRFLSYAPVGDQIDIGWARWFFLSDQGLRLIQRASPGSADRNRTLSMSRFEALEIPLPPIEEQLAAVAYLESVRSWERSISEYLTRNEAGALAGALPTFVDGLIANAATGHEPVGKLADFMSDTIHPGNDPSPADTFVGLQHIESHTGRCIGSDTLESIRGRKFRFRPGDVVYGYLRPYQNKVWVADRHGLCSVDQYVLRPREGVSPALLAHTLRGRRVLDSAIDLTHNLQLPRLRSGLLSSIEVPVVTGRRATKLAEQLDLLRDRIVVMAAKRQLQIKLSKALIPAALNETFGSSLPSHSH